MIGMKKLSRLEILAVQMALEAPIRRGTYSQHAGVNWRTMLELRQHLELLGYDWRAGVKERQRIERNRPKNWRVS